MTVGTTSFMLVEATAATVSTLSPISSRSSPALRARETPSVKYGFCGHKCAISGVIAIGATFFTTLNPTAAILASFGMGFAARPIGAFLLGILGACWGRRPTPNLAVLLIGAATGVSGLLATYVSIGLTVPITLAALRLLQGLAVGGEWGGATTIPIEHAPPPSPAAALPWCSSAPPRAP